MQLDRELNLLNRLTGQPRRTAEAIFNALAVTRTAIRDANDRRRSRLDEIDSLRITIEKNKASAGGESAQYVGSLTSDVDNEQRAIARIDAELAALGILQRRQTAIADRLLNFLGKLPTGKIPRFEPWPTVKLNRGESEEGALKRVRVQIADLHRELGAATSAKEPLAAAKEIAMQKIAALAEAGRPKGSALTYDDEDYRTSDRISFPTSFLNLKGGEGHAEIPDVLAIMAWLFKDQLTAAVLGELEKGADESRALTPEARTAEIRRIGFEIDQLERQEAAFIDALSRSGVIVDHRESIGIPALLGVSIDQFDNAPKATAKQMPTATRDAIWQ